MNSKFIIILFFLSLNSSGFLFAQDSANRKDTITLYRNIETYSKKNKFTKFFYGLIFKTGSTSAKKNFTGLRQPSYAPFEGKIIRHIYVETLDPFGYSIDIPSDNLKTIPAPQNSLLKTGNKLHVKSKGITIKNLLIIRPNQKFDSLRVKESERLIRSQSFVHDVSFFIKKTGLNSDSVDVYVRELDNWSIAPGIPPSATRLTINLTDKNFLGLGHEFENSFTWFHTKGQVDYNTNYYIPNILNTYINSTVHYGTDRFGNFTESVSIDRPFFSPLAKWAGGISVSTHFRIDSAKDISGLYGPLHSKSTVQDYWAGKAIKLFKGNLEEQRVTNLILTARYLRVNYTQKPLERFDPYQRYTSEDFYFAGLGISARRYIKDKYIFGFGVTEDVPVGRVYSVTGGYQKKNNQGRFYLGARISYGNYQNWGYWSANYEYSTFFNGSKTEQGAILAGINYFTPLFKIGSWKFRQFVKPQFAFGLNRFPYDSLTLNKGYGLEGFNSRELRGTKRMALTVQTQSYAPWNLAGFNFGPYLVCSLGVLGEPGKGFNNSHVFSQFGLGVLIKNEHFVFNTFQLSFSFYPQIPGKGDNIIKINSLKTTDIGFRDFEIGKPSTVLFQ